MSAQDPSDPNYWHADLMVFAVYVAIAAPLLTLFVLRRNREPIKARLWYMAIVPPIYGVILCGTAAVSGELEHLFGAVPCHLPVWVFVPLTCFVGNVRLSRPPQWRTKREKKHVG
jgi:hypothetical protein